LSFFQIFWWKFLQNFFFIKFIHPQKNHKILIRGIIYININSGMYLRLLLIVSTDCGLFWVHINCTLSFLFTSRSYFKLPPFILSTVKRSNSGQFFWPKSSWKSPSFKNLSTKKLTSLENGPP
jgi:hypothetical protein